MKLHAGIAALALVAGACFLPAAEVTCASAQSMDGLMAAWTKGFNATHPGTPARIVRHAQFSADFIEPLARGEVSVAAFARELFPAEQARFAALVGAAPLVVPVAAGSRDTKGGTHAIVIFVNAQNPLAHLSLPQLREIWARDGRFTTWGQLGLSGEWAERKITLHGMRVRRATGNPPGIVNYLESRLLAGRAWRGDIHEYSDIPGGAQSLEQIVRAVADDPAAIGYSGFAYAVPGVKALMLGETDAGPFFSGTAEDIARGDYPLTRTLYLCAGQVPDAATLEFLHYVLSPAGQGAFTTDAEKFFALSAKMAAVAQVAADPARPAYEPRPVAIPQGATYLTPDRAVAIIGYNDMAGMLGALDDRFSALHPGLRFAPTLKGTRTAPPALARGTSAFAPMGAEFSPEQLAAYRAVTGGGEPIAIRIAHASLSRHALSGPLAIIVHPSNPLAALTLAQVAEIFSSRASRGLHPCGLRSELALGIFLRRRTGLGDKFSADFQGFAQSADVVHQVAGDPLAIGFTAVNRVTPGVKVLAVAAGEHHLPVALTEENVRAGLYPLDRFLWIYVRQPLDALVREYLRFVLSREGQEIVAADALGYLPLNAAEAAAERKKL